MAYDLYSEGTDYDAFILEYEDPDWQTQIEPPLNPDSMTIFCGLMFKDQTWFRGANFSEVEKGYYSPDKMAGLYTCGLKTVVENYMDDVIGFYR